MLIQERLLLILKMHNMTPSAFADRLGVQRSNVSHVISGRNKPSLDFLEKIILNFPRVNAHWLLTGQMIADADMNLALTSDTKAVSKSSKEEKGGQSIESIVRIVEFYIDGTFKEYTPRA